MEEIALELQTHDHDGAVVISATGEVDLSNAARLRQAGVAVLQVVPAGGLLVVDLSGLVFMDSAGLGVTVQLLKAARKGGLRVAVVVEHPLVLRLFTITGVDRAFPVSTTLDGALAAA